MAVYYSVIPNSVPAKTVFDVINGETTGGMEGIVVSAHGNERISDYFSVENDIVYKACTSRDEIFDKIRGGSLVGTLTLQTQNWRVHIWRDLSKVLEDDCSVPNFAFYTVGVTLIAYPAVNDAQRVMEDYQKWLGPLEAPATGNRYTGVYGSTRDVIMHYQLPFGSISGFPEKLSLEQPEPSATIYGQVQEREELRKFEVDLPRYGFPGLYSVFADWPVPSVSNYPLTTSERFCSAVDTAPKSVRINVGRKYVAYRAQDGRSTRTLGGNHFQIYNTKTRRSVCVGFEQYSDEDIPVRFFSGKVRAKLKELGISI